MADANEVKCPQNEETTLSHSESPFISARYAYARSHDSFKNQTNGQDYLAFANDGKLFSFVICDGVSQSFYGELAAKTLGDSLLSWLTDSAPKIMDELERKTSREKGIQLEEEIKEVITGKLNGDWRKEAHQKVEEQAFPVEMPELVRASLNGIRKSHGSETVFMGVSIYEASESRVNLLIVSAGDLYLDLYPKTDQQISSLNLVRNYQNRWSTVAGLKGNLDVGLYYEVPLERLIAYSDGLSQHIDTAKEPIRSLSAYELESNIRKLKYAPTSDDISLIDVILKPHPVPPNFYLANSNTSLPPELNLTVRYDPREGGVALDWSNTNNALSDVSFYWILQKISFSETEVRLAIVDIKPGNIDRDFIPVEPKKLTLLEFQVHASRIQGNLQSPWENVIPSQLPASPERISVPTDVSGQSAQTQTVDGSPGKKFPSSSLEDTSSNVSFSNLNSGSSIGTNRSIEEDLRNKTFAVDLKNTNKTDSSPNNKFIKHDTTGRKGNHSSLISNKTSLAKKTVSDLEHSVIKRYSIKAEVKFSWKAVNGATSYRLYVSKTATVEPFTVHYLSMPPQTLLLDYGEYKVFVKPDIKFSKTEGYEPSLPISIFLLPNDPPREGPKIEAHLITNHSAKAEWDYYKGYFRYDVEVSEDQSFTKIIRDMAKEDFRFTYLVFGNPYDVTKTFFIRVRVHAPLSPSHPVTSPWSNVSVITLEPATGSGKYVSNSPQSTFVSNLLKAVKDAWSTIDKNVVTYMMLEAAGDKDFTERIETKIPLMSRGEFEIRLQDFQQKQPTDNLQRRYYRIRVMENGKEDKARTIVFTPFDS